MVDPLSFKVLTTLAAYRIVSPHTAGSNTVTYPAGQASRPIGVTMDTVKDTTQSIPIAGPGRIARVLFNDSLSTGLPFGSDSSGRGVPLVLTTAGVWQVGVLLGPTVGATGSSGTIAEALIWPCFVSIP